MGWIYSVPLFQREDISTQSEVLFAQSDFNMNLAAKINDLKAKINNISHTDVAR